MNEVGKNQEKPFSILFDRHYKRLFNHSFTVEFPKMNIAFIRALGNQLFGYTLGHGHWAAQINRGVSIYAGFPFLKTFP